MYRFDNTNPAQAGDTSPRQRIALACDQLRDGGIDALEATFSAMADLIQADPAPLEPMFARAVATVIDAFEADPRSPAAYAALARLDPVAAVAMARLVANLLSSVGGELFALSEAQLTGIVALVSAADEHERAAIILAEVLARRPDAGLRHAAWMARCRWAGCDARVFRYWPDAFAIGDEAAAKARIERQPLAIDAHREQVRALLERDEPILALAALATALALPIGAADKLDCAYELAMVSAVLVVRGERMALSRPHIAWPLAVSGIVAARAAELQADWFAQGALPFIDEQELDWMRRHLEAAARSGNAGQALAAGETPATAYPMRDGKPHVETVWLEITNFCNQKCTFCPDMFREDARTWLPLDQIKSLIDELADTISVGSMQLNAYGEPLLHPNIDEILAYLRERRLPWPTFFTTHGLTLVDKKLKQLSNNYPQGIAVSLHNDSQESYAATRSAKIGDYDTLVARVAALLHQMAEERAPSHLRLYQMVSNHHVDMRVAAETRAAFPETPERMIRHVRKWEQIGQAIADAIGSSNVRAHVNSDEQITRAFHASAGGDSQHLRVLTWTDVNGNTQEAFMSPRPATTYANLLLEYDPSWNVERKLLSSERCYFTGHASLAIFASRRLGICCVDLNSTATFGSLDDFGSLREALTSPQALEMFAQLSNGVAASRGCQICLGSTQRLCGES